MTALELPGRALVLYGTEFSLPARCKGILSSPLVDQQEIDVSFNMGRDCSPALFIAVNSLQRHAEEFCQLFLRLAQFFPGKTEFFLGQE